MLDERIAAKPSDFPEIDPDRTFVHQLHRLPPESLRELALRLAKKKGMME
jgi:hypothetical protein